MDERRKSRLGLQVIHRHRVADQVFHRRSELVLIEGQPKAILNWINLGDVRTPIYLCELDPSKLHPAAGEPNTFFYDGTTVDPRVEALGPAQPESGTDLAR